MIKGAAVASWLANCIGFLILWHRGVPADPADPVGRVMSNNDTQPYALISPIQTASGIKNQSKVSDWGDLALQKRANNSFLVPISKLPAFGAAYFAQEKNGLFSEQFLAAYGCSAPEITDLNGRVQDIWKDLAARYRTEVKISQIQGGTRVEIPAIPNATELVEGHLKKAKFLEANIELLQPLCVFFLYSEYAKSLQKPRSFDILVDTSGMVIKLRVDGISGSRDYRYFGPEDVTQSMPYMHLKEVIDYHKLVEPLGWQLPLATRP